MIDLILQLPPVVQAVIRALMFVIVAFTMVPVSIWLERRLLSWMQDRIGPNRVGNITFSTTSKRVPAFLKGKKIHLFGILQPIADGVKSFFKEDLAPKNVDHFLFFIAPVVSLFPALALGATIPWGPWTDLTPVADVNIGVLYILAISSLGVYGVVLAGYSSNNKYALLGGLRASAQLISYELAMSMAVAAVVMTTGSLRPTQIVAEQSGPLWGIAPGLQNWNIFTPTGFVAGVIFLICMVAETNRAPFDLPECESELIGGYNTEYTTKKWVLFMMGEYVAMVTYGAIFATLFLGGWNVVPIRWSFLAEQEPVLATPLGWMNGLNMYLAPVWLIGKVLLIIASYIWARATLPRLRYDQLMSLGWKSLLPLGTANLILVGLWMVATRVGGPVVGWAAWAVASGIVYALYTLIKKTVSADAPSLAPRTIRLDHSPAVKPVPEPAEPVSVAS